MSKSYNYQAATVEAIAQHFQQGITNQAYSQAVNYYGKKGDLSMVTKLQRARALANIRLDVEDYNGAYGADLKVIG